MQTGFGQVGFTALKTNQGTESCSRRVVCPHFQLAAGGLGLGLAEVDRWGLRQD